jgi:hypothetical protein
MFDTVYYTVPLGTQPNDESPFLGPFGNCLRTPISPSAVPAQAHA